MPRDLQVLLYIGIKNAVIALDDSTGFEVWRTELRASDFVSVLWDGEALFATNSGEVWRLDPRSGTPIWHNELKGLGRGLVTLASTRRPTTTTDTGAFVAAKRQQDAAQAAATGAAT